MSKTIAAALLTHLAGETTNLATLWRIVRVDTTTFFFTDHDQDITFEGNTYVAAVGYNRTSISNKVGLNVDELNVTGFLDNSALTEADLRAGLFDFAEVFVALVNWTSLSDGQLQLRRGKMGEIIFNDSGLFETELRGLTQAYSQNIVELYQSDCRADLGDTKCKIDLLPDFVLANTAYVLGKRVRGSPNLDGQVAATLLVPADTDANDISSNAFVGTLGSQAAIQTVQKVFGAGSIEFSPVGATTPSNSFVSFADNAAFAIGSNEFTIEFQVRFKDLTNAFQVMASHYLNTGNQRSWRVARFNNTLDFFISDDGTSVAPALSISGVFNWLINTDYHVALTRDSSNNVRMFVDGVQVGATTSVTFAVHDSTAPLWLGKFLSTPGDSPMDGFIDDFRMIVGSAIYTAAFTPPSAAHTTLATLIAAQTTADFEDVSYEVTVAGTTGAVYPNFDPIIGNTTVWGGATFTAREAFTMAATVAAVTDNRIFTVTFPNGADSREVDDWFKYGAVKWETGSNAGISMEVKAFTASSDTVELFLSMPFTVQVGDTMSIYAGCDKQLSTCISKFSNVINYRGEPYIPGQGELLNSPGARR